MGTEKISIYFFRATGRICPPEHSLDSYGHGFRKDKSILEDLWIVKDARFFRAIAQICLPLATI